MLQGAVHRPLGFGLVTGPTGSGKTTTLYTAIDAINTMGKNILTIEAPVEYQLELINQIQVRDAIGLSFARILRSVLRQGPDVIMSRLPSPGTWGFPPSIPMTALAPSHVCSIWASNHIWSAPQSEACWHNAWCGPSVRRLRPCTTPQPRLRNNSGYQQNRICKWHVVTAVKSCHALASKAVWASMSFCSSTTR